MRWVRHFERNDERKIEPTLQLHVVMGLPTSMGDNLPTVSSDVLRLEIHGPQESHLSIIDVPEIFKTTTPNLTSRSHIIPGSFLDCWVPPVVIFLSHRSKQGTQEQDAPSLDPHTPY